MAPAKPSEPTPAQLAGVRWYALMMERMALQFCMTHPAQFEKLHELLKSQVGQLHALQTSTSTMKLAEELYCTPPWVLCGDVCVMNCPPEG